MSDGTTKNIRTDGGASEARRLASGDSNNSIAVDSVQTQKGPDANNLREGGGNY